MEKLRLNPKWVSSLWLISVVFVLLFFIGASSEKTPDRNLPRSTNHRELLMNNSLGVQLFTKDNQREVTMDNGIVQVTLSSPDGFVTGIKYNGIDNVLQTKNEVDDRGYWDVVWYEPGKGGDINIDKLPCTDFRVIKSDEEQLEISFTRKWNISLRGSKAPLNVDKRFILRSGLSGFYYYAILEREKGWPDVDIDQTRIVFKLQQEMFHFMAITDDRQRIMPMMVDRESGQALDYPEAVLLTNPINKELRLIFYTSYAKLLEKTISLHVFPLKIPFKTFVDDKYQYSMENKDNKVHGWITTDDTPVGFWMISPSDEFRSGGPTSQDLTSHVGPIVINMFTSIHYGGKEINTEFRNGEAWKKVLGPSLVYLNSASSKDKTLTLWTDAKTQMDREVQQWPYNFINSEDFPKQDQRGSVFGQLKVNDRFISERLMDADSAYVGLAAPGDVGSFQIETKGYQFWTRTTKTGSFVIKNIRVGNYSLYAWVPGFIGNYQYQYNIIVTPGSKIDLKVIVYEPPRNGPTLWEIGIPDRSAAEFFIPDPNPTLMNKLFNNHPDKLLSSLGNMGCGNDMEIYIAIGILNTQLALVIILETGSLLMLPGKFFLFFFIFYLYSLLVRSNHCDVLIRNIGKKTYEGTTWQIIFQLESWKTGNYKLQLALASANGAEIQVRFNDADRANRALFSTGLIGKDNAIARHGIHGLYKLYTIDVPSSRLQKGNNTLYLTQSRHIGAFEGVMYDYIRLEGPTGN
ncbi:hypothetical protein EZV62_014629 [Acer yangbiense]|uniref:rhamnogalacturonan endolyase n=1 Tax=Acer yangbiense TaxID=1000413 RepID=A0A5C7HUW3_9ROSI|nr:hypothetical protein EZV62_014629 [Acer yangbiense]